MFAGADDLLAYLSILEVDDEQDALMIIRPFIHTMCLYVRRNQDHYQFYLFDSQAWETRYYPTRLIIHAIQTAFQKRYQEADIILSGCMVQPQSRQWGCTEYVFSFIEYLSNSANKLQFMKLISNISHINAGISGNLRGHFKIKHESFAAHLKLLDIDQLKQGYLNKLDDILRQNYCVLNSISFDKVEQAVFHQMGAHLADSIISSCQYDPYPIIVDRSDERSNAMVTIQFPSKDWLYSQFLFYSDEVYPGLVKTSSLKFIGKPRSHEWMRHGYNERENCIQYFAKDIKTLKQIFSDIQFNLLSEPFAKNGCKQTLALQVFFDKVKDKIELQLLCMDRSGGFDQSQVQLALQYYTKRNHKIYVPSPLYAYLSESSISLSWLYREQYEVVLFPMKINDEHQVGVLIRLNDQCHEVVIIDSYNLSKNIELCKIALKKILVDDEKSYRIHVINPGVLQDDDWSCGVHVVVNLLSASGLPFSFKSDHLKSRAEEIYYAAKKQEFDILKTCHKINQYENQKNWLYAALKPLLDDKRIKQLKQHASLVKLYEFMHLELYGSLSSSSFKQMNDSGYYRFRSIDCTIAAFRQYDANNTIGILLLAISEYSSYLVKFDLAELIINFNDRNQLAACFDTELTMWLNNKDQNNGADHLDQLLNEMLSMTSWSAAITKLLHEIDCAAYCDSFLNQDKLSLESIYYGMVVVLLQRVTSNPDYVNNESRQLTAALHQAEVIESKRSKELSELFEKYIVIPSKQELTLFSRTPILYQAIKRYFNDVVLNDWSFHEIRELYEVFSKGKVHAYDLASVFPHIPSEKQVGFLKHFRNQFNNDHCYRICDSLKGKKELVDAIVILRCLLIDVSFSDLLDAVDLKVALYRTLKGSDNWEETVIQILTVHNHNDTIKMIMPAILTDNQDYNLFSSIIIMCDILQRVAHKWHYHMIITNAELITSTSQLEFVLTHTKWNVMQKVLQNSSMSTYIQTIDDLISIAMVCALEPRQSSRLFFQHHHKIQTYSQLVSVIEFLKGHEVATLIGAKIDLIKTWMQYFEVYELINSVEEEIHIRRYYFTYFKQRLPLPTSLQALNKLISDSQDGIAYVVLELIGARAIKASYINTADDIAHFLATVINIFSSNLMKQWVKFLDRDYLRQCVKSHDDLVKILYVLNEYQQIWFIDEVLTTTYTFSLIRSADAVIKLFHALVHSMNLASRILENYGYIAHYIKKTINFFDLPKRFQKNFAMCLGDHGMAALIKNKSDFLSLSIFYSQEMRSSTESFYHEIDGSIKLAFVQELVSGQYAELVSNLPINVRNEVMTLREGNDDARAYHSTYIRKMH